MAHAAELLVTTALSIGEIADRCGYSSQSRFGADFRRVWSETPSGYRRARKQSLSPPESSAGGGEPSA